MMTRKSLLAVCVLFLCVLYVIPIWQTVLDLRNGEVPFIHRLFVKIPTEKNLRAFESELEDRSFIENLIRPSFQYFLYKVGGDGGAKAVLGLGKWLFYTPEIDYLSGPYYNDTRLITPVGDTPKQDWDALAAILDFHLQLQKRGIELLVVPVPCKPAIYPEFLSRRGKPDMGNLSSHTIKLMEALQANGVPVIDLFIPFLEEKKNDSRSADKLYLMRDTHWTYRGIRIAAKIIADSVRQKDWYDSLTGHVEYETRDTLTLRFGDIGEMTQLPKNRELFPAETTLAFRVFQKESGKPYRNSVTSPILYLGDSYSRIYQTDAPKNAGIVSHLAKELSLPLKAIVNNGGASTLVREQLSLKPNLLNDTRLVIWEFTERDVVYGTEGWKKIKLGE